MIKKRVLQSLIALITMVGFIFMLSPSLEASAQEETAPVPSEILDTLSSEEQGIIKRIAPTVKEAWTSSLTRDIRELETTMEVLTPVESAKLTLMQNELNSRERAARQESITQKQEKEELFFNLFVVLIVAVIFLVVLMGVGLVLYSLYTYTKNHLFKKKKDVKTHDVT